VVSSSLSFFGAGLIFFGGAFSSTTSSFLFGLPFGDLGTSSSETSSSSPDPSSDSDSFLIVVFDPPILVPGLAPPILVPGLVPPILVPVVAGFGCSPMLVPVLAGLGCSPMLVPVLGASVVFFLDSLIFIVST